MSGRAWRRHAAAVPAIGLSAAPKMVCPICSPGYAALLSSLGVGFLASVTYLLPLTAAMLTLAAVTLRVGASSRRGLAPFWIGVGASACILAGKFWLDSAPTTYLGIVLLAIASVWNAAPRARHANSCPRCLPAGTRPNASAGG